MFPEDLLDECFREVLQSSSSFLSLDCFAAPAPEAFGEDAAPCRLEVYGRRDCGGQIELCQRVAERHPVFLETIDPVARGSACASRS